MILKQIRPAVCFIFIIVLTVSMTSAFAAVNTFRTIEDMAGSEYLVVGRVKSITDGDRFVSEGKTFRMTLVKKHAVLDVYRSYPSIRNTRMLNNNELAINYLGVDYKEKYHYTFSSIENIPAFPTVNVGDIFAFPMHRSADDSEKLVLQNELNHIRLIPCLKQQIPDAITDTALDFLYSEIAGTFAYGSYKDIYNAVGLLDYFTSHKMPEQLFSLIDKNVKDTNRWFDIFVIEYCSLDYPRIKLTELGVYVWPEHMITKAEFINYALMKASPDKLEDQFVSSIVRHADINYVQSIYAFDINDQYKKTIIRILSDVLNSKRFTNKTLRLAVEIIDNKDFQFSDSIVRASIEASKSYLVNNENVGIDDIIPLGRFIAIHGNDDDFSILVNEMRKTGKYDKSGFDALLRIAMDVNPSKQKTISVCRVLIDNKNDYKSGLTYRDFAVMNLQQATGEDFGFDKAKIKFLRYESVIKAKEWLRKNPDK